MASSVFMSSDQNTNTNPTASIHVSEDQDQKPIRRSSGRRKTKGSEGGQKNKKQPQRGMGVAQLEKLRIQNSANQSLPINHPPSFANLTVMNPNSVPMQFAKMGGFGTVNGGGVGQMGFNQNPNPSSLGFQFDPFAVGGLKNSKELSSNPNGVKCYYQPCNVCHKKKRVNGDKSSMYMQMSSPISNCDFLRLNNQTINQETEIQTPVTAGYSVRNCQPGVEVVAFHRKGNASRGNIGAVMMEYDFLGVNSEILASSSSSSAAVYSSCYADHGEGGFDGSNCLDLSLKLSY